MTIQLDQKQLEAVERCCDKTKRIVAINGKAGTGKTTIQKIVADKFIESGYEVALAAPLGRAARRITQATGLPAFTIHKLLEYPMPGEIDEETGKAYSPGQPRRHRYSPMQYDVIIVDEYAMVPYELHRNLLDAMKPGSIIRMFGDANQLRPIEESKRLQSQPTMFSDMLEKFTSVELDHIHRQDEGSGILYNASRILRGGIPLPKPDFPIIQTAYTSQAVKEIVMKDLKAWTGMDNQIITPMRQPKAKCCAYNLSNEVQRLVDPDMRYAYSLDRHGWSKKMPVSVRVGDKVVFTKNDYSIDLRNGDIGIIKQVNRDGVGSASLVVEFEDFDREIPPEVSYTSNNGDLITYNPQRNIDLASALSTHKVQGSEFKEIIYVINSAAQIMLRRDNTYTGITRAKHKVHFVCDRRALNMCVRPPIGIK